MIRKTKVIRIYFLIVSILISSIIPFSAVQAEVTPTKSKLLILLVEFNDIKLEYSSADFWYNERIFGTGNTVKSIFDEMTYGKVEVAPASESSETPDDGIIKVKLNYDQPFGIDYVREDGRDYCKEMFLDALTASDQYINYKDYDLNGDNIVSREELRFIAIIANFDGNTAVDPGAFASNTEGIFLDGVLVGNDGYAEIGEGYIEIKEVDGQKVPERKAHGFGTHTHELAHNFYAHDVYDAHDNYMFAPTDGVGIHSLMCGGYVLDPWNSIVRCGFTTPTVVVPYSDRNEKVFELIPFNSKAEGIRMVKICLNPEGTEYFIVENHQLQGFDALPEGKVVKGAAIWHIDESIPNNFQGNYRKVDIEEANAYASGKMELDDKKCYDVNNHYFGKDTQTVFGPNTYPSSHLNNGQASGVTIQVGEALPNGSIRLYINSSEINFGDQNEFKYLSDIDEKYASGTIKKDSSKLSKLMNINGRWYPKGICVDEVSEVHYDLGGRYSSFEAALGIDRTIPNPVRYKYLSDMQRSYEDYSWSSAKNDVSMDEKTLTINGEKFLKGLGVHSYSEIHYSLDGSSQRFYAKVGIDDEVGDNGEVSFKVYVDTKDSSNLKYESHAIKGSDGAAEIDVDITGARKLILVVEDKGDGYCDHADWGDAKLIENCVRYEVWSDGERIYESKPIGYDMDPVIINVPVSGRQELVLKVLDVNSANYGNPVNWADARLRTEVTYLENMIPSEQYTDASNQSREYNIYKNYTEFSADVYLADGSIPTSAVTYEIWGDGQLLESVMPHIGKDNKIKVSAEVTGMEKLALVVRGINEESVPIWENANLVKNVTYLSDMSWVGEPANSWGPVEKDYANGGAGVLDGFPIVLNGVVYGKGLGTHADSEINYDLGGQYSKFISDIGVDDIVEGFGTINFKVFVDGEEKYVSGLMTGESETKTVEVDVKDAAQLKLVVENYDGSSYADHGDWAGARLIRKLPSDVVTPTPTVSVTPTPTVTPTVTVTPTPTVTITPTLTATIIPTPTLTPTPTSTSTSISSGLIVKMYNGSTVSVSNMLNPKFNLTNTGTMPISLEDVKVRYYYTIDGAKPQSFWCDWTTVGSSNITSQFVNMSSPQTGADTYLEIGFTSGAGTLNPGNSIEVQTRIAKSDWSNYTQTGDYSFNSTATSYVEWNKVTAYVNQMLQWGVEP